MDPPFGKAWNAIGSTTQRAAQTAVNTVFFTLDIKIPFAEIYIRFKTIPMVRFSKRLLRHMGNMQLPGQTERMFL
jgi:hypothetical protein